MQNARSYLGRFSGLVLFLIALLIVGLLVVFTIRSADDEGIVTTEDEAGTSEIDGAEEPQAIPDLDSGPIVTGDTEDEPGEEGTVAGDEDGLPNTGPEDGLLPAAAIGLLAWQVWNYLDSRRLLKSPAPFKR